MPSCLGVLEDEDDVCFFGVKGLAFAGVDVAEHFGVGCFLRDVTHLAYGEHFVSVVAFHEGAFLVDVRCRDLAEFLLQFVGHFLAWAVVVEDDADAAQPGVAFGDLFENLGLEWVSVGSS